MTILYPEKILMGQLVRNPRKNGNIQGKMEISREKWKYPGKNGNIQGKVEISKGKVEISREKWKYPGGKVEISRWKSGNIQGKSGNSGNIHYFHFPWEKWEYPREKWK